MWAYYETVMDVLYVLLLFYKPALAGVTVCGDDVYFNNLCAMQQLHTSVTLKKYTGV
jgi:hypothetical protein